jgi:hypothetical protein
MSLREETLQARMDFIKATLKCVVIALDNNDINNAREEVSHALSLAAEPLYVATEASYREATEQQLRRPQ